LLALDEDMLAPSEPPVEVVLNIPPAREMKLIAPIQKITLYSPRSWGVRPGSEPHGATTQQAFEKTPAK
jgi:hypothetical protein